MSTQKAPVPFRNEAFGMITILLLEFLFGIYTTLYVHFPEGATADELWKFTSKQMIVNIHMLLGIIIAIGTLAFFIRILMQKAHEWIPGATFALCGVLIATVAGFIFVPSQSDMYAYAMSVGFTIAVFGYALGIFKTAV